MINFPLVMMGQSVMLCSVLLLAGAVAAAGHGDENARVIAAQPVIHDIRRAIRENDIVQLRSLVEPTVIVNDFRIGGAPAYRWTEWLEARGADRWRNDVPGSVSTFASVSTTTKMQANICVWRTAPDGDRETFVSNGIMVIELSGGLGAGFEVTRIDYVAGSCP